MANVLVKKVKREMISMSVYDSITRVEFWVDRIEGWENLVKAIFHVYHVAFDKTMLPSC